MKYLIFIFLIFSACGKEDDGSQDIGSLGEIDVKVFDEENLPVEKVTVLISNDGDPSGQTLSGVTNSDGFVTFSELTPGSYQVKVEDLPWVPASREIMLNPGEAETVSLRVSIPFEELKILSYNIREGLENDDSKKEDFVQWVEEHDPDIICFQELNGFSKNSLDEFASRYGHNYTEILKETGYPVGVSSKFPITNVQRIFDQMVHGALSVQIKDLNVVVVHLSPTTLESRITEIKELVDFEETLSGDLTIFAGDFNSYSEFDQQAYGPDFEKDMLERISTVPVDFTVTNTLKEIGYVEAYPLFHNVFKRTLPTERFREPDNPGARYDYIFLSNSLEEHTVSADIIHDEVTHYLSDHYPVIIQLEREGQFH